MYPYMEAFRAIETSLKREAEKAKPLAEVEQALEPYRRFDSSRTLDDDKAWRLLVHDIFYAGFQAEMVDAKLEEIDRHLGDVRRVANLGSHDIEQILADPKMIRHPQKVEACRRNAVRFLTLIEEYGSFGSFVASFEPAASFENLLLLKGDMESRFFRVRETTAYHVLMDLGLPVLKPDRVIMRIFQRLKLVRNRDDLLGAVIHGRRLAALTDQPIRYVDIVFVAYGQVRSEWLGLQAGICLEESPRCDVCLAQRLCRGPGAA